MSNVLIFLLAEAELSTRMEKPGPLMRKQPAQARSRATVDAVVEAAARILGGQGWGGFTTNKVAAAAGVSIGSYYQYFPDKHSLIDAIRERHLAECLATVRAALDGDKPAKRFVEELVDGIIALHGVNPGLHRVLLDEAPSSQRYRDPDSAFEREYLGYFRAAVVPAPKS
jgi:AcrR family transcriptional regulator